MSILEFGCRQEPLYLDPNGPNTYVTPNVDLKPAPDFFEVNDGLYTSWDPRLYDPVRNIRLHLDRAAVQPLNVQPLRNVYSQKLPSTGQYRTIEDIRLGNVIRYVSPFTQQVYPSPIYQMTANVQGVLFQDPMGSVKPYYLREPVMQHNKALSNYTFDQDQMSFREDIMARQSQKMNRTDFSKFYMMSSPNDS